MESNDGFIPILAVFYAVFHPTEGTKIIHQVPEGSIISNVSQITDNSLFNFDTVKNYIIPKPQLCNKLVSFKIDKFRVLGYPVNIESQDYSRNSFNFNFGFVFPYDSDTTPYEPAIKRMGKMFRVLEEQSFMLSKLEKKLSFFPRSAKDDGKDQKIRIPPLIADEFNNNNNRSWVTPGHSRIKKFNLSSIESLIHQIYQDLNNYSECCIPLDSANSVDIKLFPILPPPINIKAYQVPVVTVKLNSLVDVNWDPTMLKILPYINGINSIKRISELADADYLLTKQCVQHLMHYKCINIVDIFQFSNIYAPTNNIGNFLKLSGMAEECQAYVVTAQEGYNSQQQPPLTDEVNGKNFLAGAIEEEEQKHASSGITPGRVSKDNNNESNNDEHKSSSGAIGTNNASGRIPQKKQVKVASKATLFFLYRSLNQGQTVKEWYIQHRKKLVDIDIRRFINFGMLRGIIYRVYSYPMVSQFVKAVERNNDEEIDNLTQSVLKEMAHAKSTQNARHKFQDHRHGGAKTRQSSFVERSSIPRPRPSISSEAEGLEEAKLLRNTVRAANLTTARYPDSKSQRKVSFGYHVEGRNHVMTPVVGESDDLETFDRALQDDDSDDAAVDSGSELGASLSESDSDNDDHSDSDDDSSGDDYERDDMIKLVKLLKGYQTIDSICTELQKSRNDIESMIDRLGSYSIINS